MDLYADPASESRFREWHQKMVKESGSGGVSDMTLFYWFQKEHPDVLGDYPAIFGDSPIDVSLEEIRGFESDEDGFKKLLWNGCRPCALKKDGQFVELLCLHHQGWSKCRIKKHSRLFGISVIHLVLLIPYFNIMYKIIRRKLNYIT